MKKNFLKEKKIWLTAAAVVLAGTMSLPGAMAYFTATASASGSHTLVLGPKSDVTEKVDDGDRTKIKHISVQNTGDVESYVRVKIFAGSQFTVKIGGKGWTERDGYWYYDSILPAGATADELAAEITIPDTVTGDFNVAVVEEATPVTYDKDGNPTADWNMKAEKLEGSDE